MTFYIRGFGCFVTPPRLLQLLPDGARVDLPLGNRAFARRTFFRVS
jgi:hypothetical protein